MFKCLNIEDSTVASHKPVFFFKSLSGSSNQSSSEHLNSPFNEIEENLIRDAGEVRDQMIEDRWERDQS